MANHDVRVRELAYCLWEAEGKSEGKDLEFWCRAELHVLSEAQIRIVPLRRANLTMPQCAPVSAKFRQACML
jgi:Protein of unknown function (DUF2934)